MQLRSCCFLFFTTYRHTPRTTRTDTRFPYTNLVPSPPLLSLFEVPTSTICGTNSSSPPSRPPPSPLASSRPPPVASPLAPVFSRPPPVASSAFASSPSRSEEHTSELQSLMRLSYAVFCLNKHISPCIHLNKLQP